MAQGAWLQPATARPDAALRVLLIPYAGAGAAAFHPWLRLMPADVAAQCVQLPGRQERLAEPALTSIDAAVEALARRVRDSLDGRPYGLFGHSMGALLAYRLAVALGADGPVLLGASGWAPEGFAMPSAELAALPGPAVLARLRELGWVPAEVSDKHLLALVVPPMRADMALCASYADDGARVGCPVVGYHGSADHLLPAAAMSSWQGRTDRYLGTRSFPAGHLFPQRYGPQIVADFTGLLRRYAAVPGLAPEARHG